MTIYLVMQLFVVIMTKSIVDFHLNVKVIQNELDLWCQIKFSRLKRQGRQKKHVFGSGGSRRGGGCQTLACALAVTVL